jgi:hypothetical protein
MTDSGSNADAVITLGAGDDVFTTADDGFVTADLYAVNGGEGTDTLVVAAAADLNTAVEGARFTNFDTVRLVGSQDMDMISGITALELGTASSKSFTDLTAVQAAAIQVRGNQTSSTIALKTATGTSDVLSLSMGTGTTTAAATNVVTGITVTGFETLNLAENGGPTATAGANRTATVAALTGATLNTITLTGRAVDITDLATTVAVTIDGSALTGDGSTSGVQGLTVAGSAVAGSVITGSAVNDSMTIGAEGSTYSSGAGDDAFSTTMALIAADGATDLVINAGAGTDTMTMSNTTGLSMTDINFTNINGMEKMTLANTGAASTSITTGAAFNAAFADGATITSGIIAAAQDMTVAAGLSTVDTTITVASTAQTGAATETNSFVTGSGADTVTYTDTAFVGVAGAAAGTITVDTRAGDDTISITVGIIVSATTAIISITGGAGQDSITKVGVNADDAQGVATFVMAAGDSATTAYDSITGYDMATASTFADALEFEGTSAVSTFSATVDSGTIKSHAITTGITTFDDAAVFATAIVINAANLSDVRTYLATNLAANDVVAFTYDSDNSGAVDATMVFHQGSAASVADDMVMLVGITAGDALLATNASAGTGDIFIS